MTDYISREAFIKDARKRYCEDCDRRKGMKNGKMKFCYAIGDAPCRSCLVDDILTEAEDFPAADVRPVVRGEWIWDDNGMDWGIGAWLCSECKVRPETWWATLSDCKPLRCSGSKYCGNCGADMRKEAQA